ncbi:hypothetical protein BD289DRAFT_187299 [Coniella lustricola]|uniref:Uncharacterized protein n=1 Tax=Coniella lustricola TaxID=2025994 RepID=A0A2T3AD45_9PEZI|nr:hypothetical protein BD289DRAFT_187299 [Coniella lustricola]
MFERSSTGLSHSQKRCNALMTATPLTPRFVGNDYGTTFDYHQQLPSSNLGGEKPRKHAPDGKAQLPNLVATLGERGWSPALYSMLYDRADPLLLPLIARHRSTYLSVPCIGTSCSHYSSVAIDTSTVWFSGSAHVPPRHCFPFFHLPVCLSVERPRFCMTLLPRLALSCPAACSVSVGCAWMVQAADCQKSCSVKSLCCQGGLERSCLSLHKMKSTIGKTTRSGVARVCMLPICIILSTPLLLTNDMTLSNDAFLPVRLSESRDAAGRRCPVRRSAGLLPPPRGLGALMCMSDMNKMASSLPFRESSRHPAGRIRIRQGVD